MERLDPPQGGFFAKRLRDGSIDILAHPSVSDDALVAARTDLELLLGHAPRLRANLEHAHQEIHVIGLRQLASDLPEMRRSRGSRVEAGELFDYHMIGGHLVGRFSSCTEGTLLPVVGHRAFGEESCLHELAHAIELRAMSNAARARVAEAYELSIRSGHWAGQYAASNDREWFAEITRLFFRPVRPEMSLYDPLLSRGHDWLCEYDPAACELVSQVYSDAFDPGTPRTVTIQLGPGVDQAKLRSERSRVPTTLVVDNHTSARVRLVWIDYAGQPTGDGQQGWIDAGASLEQSSWKGHTFAVVNASGAPLCTFTAPGDDGVANVTGPCN